MQKKTTTLQNVHATDIEHSFWLLALVHGPSPAGPPLIFEDESYQRSKQILGNLNGRNCGQLLSSGL